MDRGSFAVIYGDVAPEGAVIKLTGHKVDKFEGPACVFDSEEDAFHAVQDGSVGEGDVIIIRYEGPKGGPGMREMLQVTAALKGRKIDNVALLTDGRQLRLRRRPYLAGSRRRRPDRPHSRW